MVGQDGCLDGWVLRLSSETDELIQTLCLNVQLALIFVSILNRCQGQSGMQREELNATSIQHRGEDRLDRYLQDHGHRRP